MLAPARPRIPSIRSSKMMHPFRCCVQFLVLSSLFTGSPFPGSPFPGSPFPGSLVAAEPQPGRQIELLPRQISLHGAQASQQVLIQQRLDAELGPQLVDGIELESSDPTIASVEDDRVIPKRNGAAVITARWRSARAQAKVVVTGMEDEVPWTFRNHVQAVLAKKGCNSGACHGALAGKGGFKLSLRGYDTDRDFFTITRQARGRRVERADPGRSLLLAKPSGALAHKGGLRFETDSLEYGIISDWIAAGAPAPGDDDPRISRLEVLPQRTALAVGDAQQMLVRAHYSDGRVEDVTRWAKFSSTDEAVATVDQQGRATVIGHGEGAITAWFSSKIVIARITAPFENKVDPQVYAEAPRASFLDELVLKQLERLNLPPSPAASDAEFLRRAFIDTIGTLPTAQEVRSYLADPATDKRQKLVETLLERPEFVDYWTYRWADILLINGTRLRPQAVKAYYEWVHERVQENTPWDEFVREIVTAQGSSFENGATNFYALHQDPENMTENVCQAFLGLSIACAKCHNHPLEKWTNDQYYAMANMFARVRAKGWGGDGRNGDGLRTLYVATSGELIQPLTGRPQPPTPLDGDPISLEDPEDRRIDLADWLTSPDNPYFARSITNRVWANFMGVGLVESVDDMRDSNPASNEELLSELASYVIENKFDLKSLMRLILTSHAYGRSSQPVPGNQDEKRFYARYYPRRMMAEVMLDAISQVTSVPSKFTEVAYPGADKQKTDFYPAGTRALQLYDSAVNSYFLKTFGRNQRNITCECERSDEPSMVQVLHISNGTTVNEKLSAKDNRIDQLISAGSPNYKLIEEAYLAAVARFPTDAEMHGLLDLLGKAEPSERRVVIEDIFWGLLSSREFLFNH